jgi:hypothetical protein
MELMTHGPSMMRNSMYLRWLDKTVQVQKPIPKLRFSIAYLRFTDSPSQVGRE